MGSYIGYCGKCGHYSNGATFCKECGSEMMSAYVKCPHCSKEIINSSNFCEHCGRPVQEEMKAMREGK